MNDRTIALVKAVRGPLVLIALGVLFAIDHFGPYPFDRTWPALIIVIGLWKLVEYAVMRPPASDGPFPGRM
jgi:hypothetical protein